MKLIRDDVMWYNVGLLLVCLLHIKKNFVGISVDMQQRLFDELTSTRWEDSPPIVETLSPSFVDHSSSSEIEGLHEDDQEDSQGECYVYSSQYVLN